MSEQLVHHQHHTNTNIHKIILSDKEKTIMKKSKSVDNSALTYYESGFEKNRLRSNIGIIEFERTKEILLENLPNPPAVIYDIGGAYGEYSYWLASLGYEVHLFDLFPKNIEMSNELGKEYPECSLKSAEVCDALSVPRKDKSADAVLLMGPLYHITDYSERILAIKESTRLLKDNGILFSAALTPFSVLLHNITVYNPLGENPDKTLEKPEFIKMVERELHDGHHINPDNTIYSGLGSAYLHTAKALRKELCEGGFSDTVVHGIMGGAWLANYIDELMKNDVSRNALMNTVRLLDTCEEIIGLSGHLLAVSKKS